MAPGQSPSRSRASRIWPTISRGRQIAHQPLRAGVAERAGERAADLARDAQRAAIVFGDVDGLDSPCRRASAQQPFARAVDRHLLGDDLRPVEGEASRQLGAQLLGDVGHARRSRWRRAHRSSSTAGRRACALPLRHAERPRRAPSRRGRPRTTARGRGSCDAPNSGQRVRQWGILWHKRGAGFSTVISCSCPALPRSHLVR